MAGVGKDRAAGVAQHTRPHAVANGTPGALRLPYQPVPLGFKELTSFWPRA
jgi:hypothetical protein